MKYIFSLITFLNIIFTYGQELIWADKVLGFSSEFKNDSYKGQYGVNQLLGEPSLITSNVSNACAWASDKPNNEAGEWVEVGFAKKIKAQQVFVHETYNPGAVNKITLKGEGKLLVVYDVASNTLLKEGRLLNVKFNETDFFVESVKVELRTGIVDGHNQIDAIGIANHQNEYSVKINVNPTVLNNKVEVLNLGENINTESDELCPVISPDGLTLYFTKQGSVENIGGEKDQDVWFSVVENGTFTKAKNSGEPLSTKHNNSILSITPDGQTALVNNIYYKDGSSSKGLSWSKMTENGWGFPEAIEMKNFVNNNKYGEFNLSNSGNIIVMAIETDESEGGKDLYVSFKNEDDTWSEPKHLGNKISTSASEIAPFLAADNKTLYYGTSGLPGYGGVDIFMTRRLDDSWTEWTEPENLGPYLNTPKFDAYYSFTASGEEVYFVSYRDGSKGGSDIYKAPVPKVLQPKPVTLVRGTVRNEKTKEPLTAEINYYSLSTNEKLGVAHSDPKTGEYKIVLPAGDRYGFSASKGGFLPVSTEFELKKQSKYQEKTVDLFLVPIEKNAKIILKNVYFDSDKYDLRSESKVELNQLVKILKDNPSMKVEISAHTDSDGEENYNQKLSENRAKSVVEYLKTNSIDINKLVFQGLGETMPIAPNDSKENKQLNRRVEFKILEI